MRRHFVPRLPLLRRCSALVLLALALLLSACGPDAASPTQTPMPQSSATPTAATPTQPATASNFPPTATGEPLSSTPTVAPTATMAPPSPTVAATPLSELFPELVGIAGTASLAIQDDWLGLSPLSPLEAHYELRREGDSLVGQARFSVAGNTGVPSSAAADITIPLDVAQAALLLLADAPVAEGTYEPLIDHTDDYPSLGIQTQLGDERLEFFSASQGEDHVPWGARYKGREFVVRSGAPAEAIRLLDPYLARDVQQALIDSVRNSP